MIKARDQKIKHEHQQSLSVIFYKKTMSFLRKALFSYEDKCFLMKATAFLQKNWSLMTTIVFLRKTNGNNAFLKNTMVLEGEERKTL